MEFHQGSVSNPASWESLASVHGTTFTHIVSGAAITPTRADEEANAQEIMAVNLFGCIQALEFARRCKSLHRFVFVSSDAVYEYPGLVRPLLDSEVAPSAMGLYCLSKFAGENAVARWAELYGLDACCVRFADVYGRLDRNTGARNRHNAPYWVCEAAAAGRPVVVRGSLDDIGWDYIAAPDVANALAALLRSENPPKLPVYVIGIGRPVPHRELLEAVFAAAPPAGAGYNPSIETLVALGAVVQVDVHSTELPANDGGDVHLAALPTPHPLREESYDIAPLFGESHRPHSSIPHNVYQPITGSTLIILFACNATHCNDCGADEFGWKPRPLAEAVSDYVEWLRAHPQVGAEKSHGAAL